MREKELTCIVCPMGCTLHAEIDDDGNILSVCGNTCPRGAAYAKAELTHPTRTLTSTVRLQNRDALLPVKTDRPISKEKMADAMKILRTVSACAPVHIGDVILHNLLGEADLVATGDVE